MEFKDKIKILRLQSGMTMAELAKKSNLSAPTIHRYETGEIKNVGYDKIKLLADALNTSVDFLMDLDDSISINSDFLDYNLNSLVKIYRTLNDSGKHKLLEYAKDIYGNEKYVH